MFTHTHTNPYGMCLWGSPELLCCIITVFAAVLCSQRCRNITAIIFVSDTKDNHYLRGQKHCVQPAMSQLNIHKHTAIHALFTCTQTTDCERGDCGGQAFSKSGWDREKGRESCFPQRAWIDEGTTQTEEALLWVSFREGGAQGWICLLRNRQASFSQRHPPLPLPPHLFISPFRSSCLVLTSALWEKWQLVTGKQKHIVIHKSFVFSQIQSSITSKYSFGRLECVSRWSWNVENWNRKRENCYFFI